MCTGAEAVPVAEAAKGAGDIAAAAAPEVGAAATFAAPEALAAAAPELVGTALPAVEAGGIAAAAGAPAAFSTVPTPFETAIAGANPAAFTAAPAAATPFSAALEAAPAAAGVEAGTLAAPGALDATAPELVGMALPAAETAVDPAVSAAISAGGTDPIVGGAEAPTFASPGGAEAPAVSGTTDYFGPPDTIGATPTDVTAPTPTPTVPPSLPQSTLDKVLKYGPLALGATSLIQNYGAQGKYSKQISDIGAPQRAVGQEMINQAQAGNINPADKYAIDQWEQNSITQIKSFYANAGLSDSTQATGAISDVKARATAMREKARQDLLTQGTNILNTVDQYQAQAIQAEMQGDAATAEQAMQFLNAYGSWLRALPVLTGKGTPPKTAAAPVE